MRVQCDVCESAAAAVMCCADEAALCLPCDERIHAANKLASKHQRLRLIYSHSATSFSTKGAAIDRSDADSSNPPMCDICQEKTAFIFCLEDRALLCRNCDISIHPAKTLAAGHRRLLATGIRVSLNAMDPGQKPPCSPQGKPEEPRMQAAAKSTSTPASDTAIRAYKPQPTTVPPKPPNEFTTSKRNVSNSSSVYSVAPSEPSSTSDAWQVDDVLSLPDLASGYTLGDLVSEKADIASVGEYDWMADFSIFEEHIYTESLAEVPQIDSTPNDLSLAGKVKIGYKGKLKQDTSFLTTPDDAFIVPDMSLRSDEVLTVPLKRQKMLLPGIV